MFGFYMDFTSVCSFRALLGNIRSTGRDTCMYSKCAPDRILINVSLMAVWLSRFPLFITACESDV